MDVDNTRTLGRLQRLAQGFKLNGQVRGEVIKNRVVYFLGTQSLGSSAPEARNKLRSLAGVMVEKKA